MMRALLFICSILQILGLVLVVLMPVYPEQTWFWWGIAVSGLAAMVKVFLPTFFGGYIKLFDFVVGCVGFAMLIISLQHIITGLS